MTDRRDLHGVQIKTEPINSLKESETLSIQAVQDQNGLQNTAAKRPASLDLKSSAKKRLVAPSSLIIESPGLQHNKSLSTPDFDKILPFLPTPQPGHLFPSKSTAVTSEQEAFGKGFEEALHSLRSGTKHIQTPLSDLNKNENVASEQNNTTVTATHTLATGMSGGSFTYTDLESINTIPIKDEPQNPAGSEPVSPIDMEAQEKIKLERKRQRNRVAASKCRKRKLERISKLEEKVKMLKGENTDLGSIVKQLKEHVAQLKQQVIEHIKSGCSIQTVCNSGALLQS